MKKQILILTMLFCSTLFYAQTRHISIGPKTLQKGIACKINLQQPTDIVIRIFDGKKEVKNFTYKQVKTTAVQMNLEELPFGKKYTINVYDVKNKLLHAQEITKAKK